MIYRLYAKPNVDYTKYGFVEEDKAFVLWRGTRRITIDKASNQMSLNMVTNEVLYVFMKLVRDDLVIYEAKRRPPKLRSNYLYVDDDELKMIMDKRNSHKEDIDEGKNL